VTPFLPPAGENCLARLQIGDAIEEQAFPPCDQYGIQADLFAQAILTDAPVFTPLEDAVANLRVTDAVVRSARSGRAEHP